MKDQAFLALEGLIKDIKNLLLVFILQIGFKRDAAKLLPPAQSCECQLFTAYSLLTQISLDWFEL